MAKKPTTGELRHWIDVKQPAGAQDTTGQHKPAHTSVANAWAMISPEGGSESVADGTVEGIMRYRVVFRYDSALSGITESWLIEIVESSRILEIVSVFKLDEWQEFIVLSCREAKT